MKGDAVVAKRYAKALFEAAQEQNITRQVEEELSTVDAVVRGDAEVRKFLHHPGIAAAVKADLLKQAFQGNVSQIVLNTLQLMIERNRDALLPDLVKYYVEINNEALGQANATVYTPVALSEKEQQDVAANFGQLTGKSIRIEHVIDPGLLGGIQVRIGDRLYDGSLTGKLARLEKAMKQSQAL